MPSTIMVPLTHAQTFFPAYLVYFLHRMGLIFRINDHDKMIALRMHASLVYPLANLRPPIIGKRPAKATGESDIRKLGGLMVKNPMVALLVLLAGFAMAGVPPLNAFQSKLMLIQASIQAGLPELGVLMILHSIVTFMTFMKAFHAVYMRPRPLDLEIKNDKTTPGNHPGPVHIPHSLSGLGSLPPSGHRLFTGNIY